MISPEESDSKCESGFSSESKFAFWGVFSSSIKSSDFKCSGGSFDNPSNENSASSELIRGVFAKRGTYQQ